jgi:hypothetical protein
MATSATLSSGPSLALDKAACAAAAEAGQRLRNRGQLVAAREQLIVCASPECPQVVSQDCTGWLGEVQRSLATFAVRAHDASGAPLHEVTVSLDGTVLPETAPTAPIEVDPGTHVVSCAHAGFAPSERPVLLAEGERGLAIDCELVALGPAAGNGPPVATDARPAPVPPSSLAAVPAPIATPRTSVPWVVWPLAVLGAAGAAGFVGFGIAGRNEENALTCGPYCTTEVDPAKTKFALADISLVVGAVALGGAALVLLMNASPSSAVPANASASGAPAARRQGLPGPP